MGWRASARPAFCRCDVPESQIGAGTEKEILKIYLREANATKFRDKRGEQRKLLSDHTYGVWSEKVVEIGRLVGGWISSIKNEKDGEKGNPARR